MIVVKSRLHSLTIRPKRLMAWLHQWHGYINNRSAPVPVLGPPAVTGCSGVLPTVAAACLIDWVLARSTVAAPKSGYYVITTAFPGAPNQSYVVGSAAAAANQTGVRSFCSTEEGVIRFSAVPVVPAVTTAGCVAFTALQ
jgi:hypothetical protein